MTSEAGRRAALDVVHALARAAQALGYYAPSHPACVEVRREAWATLESAFSTGSGTLSLATAGAQLIVDPSGPPLPYGPPAGLARALLRRGVLGLRLDPRLVPSGLDALLEGLVEPPSLLERRGGLSSLVRESAGIEVVAVDFRALFEGEGHRLPASAREDPVLDRALRLLLRHESGAGQPIEVRIEEVANADDLGELLEGLVQRAQSDRADRDEVADAASSAFRLHAEAIGEGHGDLAAGARALAHALVRLPPDARFELLRRLAEGAGGDGTDLVSPLGTHVDDAPLVDAIAGALSEGDESEATARAIGSLLARLRPVVAARRRLLAQIDAAVRARGRPIDGLLWQSLESRTMRDERRGLVELTDPGSVPGLVAQAQLRSRWVTKPVPGQDVLHTLDDRMLHGHLAALYVATLADDRPLPPDLAQEVRSLASTLEAEGDRAGATQLFVALGRRAERSAELRPVFRTLMEADGGRSRVPAVLAHPDTPDGVRAVLLLGALARADVAQQPRMRALLHRLPPEAFWPLLTGAWGALGPQRLRVVLEAVLAGEPARALEVARRALGVVRREDREVVVDALARAPRALGVRTLGILAGAKGDKPALRLLGLGAGQEDEWAPLAHRAVGALGAIDDLRAVAVLVFLLERPPPLFGAETCESLRHLAARALVHHRSPEAQEALSRARESRRRVVRAAARLVDPNRAPG